jgi:hypothetical protein
MRKLTIITMTAAPALTLWGNKLLTIADKVLHYFGFCIGG